MQTCVLVSLLLALGCVTINAAPVEHGGIEPGSCEDASTKAAAELALTKINLDRKEGYIFSLHRLSNAHIKKHGENSVLFYLTLDVVETNCSVLSRKDWKSCEIRRTNTPVYGQCKAAIFTSKVHRVERLYNYNCVIRPGRVREGCAGCPGLTAHSDAKVQKAVSHSLEAFNKQSGLTNRFALLQISRATAQVVAGRMYHVEYTIQETTCPSSTEAVTAVNCPPMECEFAHKGFCKASLFHALTNEENINVECEIYEPEAALREKKLHLLDGEIDHSHNDTHSHNDNQDQAHAADHTHTHDHAHDHTKCHSHHGINQNHADQHDHHHTHDHATGSAHRHAHDHSHDHGVNHDHVHAHHAQAHNHTENSPKHHDYKHADGVHTHEHDHELALDHDHKHRHLHEYEHHHHHHGHEHETEFHDHPQGVVKKLPALGQPGTQPSNPDDPAGGPVVGVVLPLKPDPQIPGQMEPPIQAFPTSVSAQCPTTEGKYGDVEGLFARDPTFKRAA